MSTSGGGWLNAVLYVAVLVLAVQIAVGRVRAGEDRGVGAAPGEGGPAVARSGGAGSAGWRTAGVVAAVGIWLVVAVPSLLQIPFPALLTHLERDPARVKQGQWWRVLTGLVVQDGGIGGTVFNLVVLAVVAFVAGQVWGRGLPLVFLATHLSFAVPAVFLSSDVGAGNSGATFGLAATIVGWAVAHRTEWARSAGVVIAGFVLIALKDAHGIPVVAGVPIGYLAEMWQTRAHHDDG